MTTSKWLSRLSFPSLRILLLCSALTFSASCGILPKLPNLGGTNVAANTQLGQENSQTLGQSYVYEYAPQTIEEPVRTVEQSQGQTNKIKTDGSNIVYNETNPWLILALVLGWILPSPNEIGRLVRRFFSWTT